MADRLEAYADWLVANQNKRGTPEFDTVANAYKQLRQQPQQQAIPAREPGVMESLGRGIADRATGIAAGITELPDTVAEAVTGFKDPRLLVPGDADQFMGVDWRNIGDTKFVENTPDIQKLQNPLGFSGDEFENAGKYLRGVQKDIDYQRITPWNEVKSNPTPQNVLAFMGEAAVTSLPDMAAALLATPAYFASYISPIAEERAKNDGRDQVTPEDLSIAATASLAIAGAERFGAKGIFGGQTGNMVTRPIKAGVRESGTEAIQETTQYGAETAGTQAGFDPAQAADQALAGAVGGFGAGTGLRATTDAVTAISGQDINARAVAEDLIAKGDVLNPKLVGNDPQAATELATRLDTIAKANDLNLKDVNKQSTSGAREAVDKAHIQVSEELKQLAKDLRTQLGITDSDELSVVLDKVMAIAGQRQARNKAKSTVGVQEMQAIERLAGNTQEGQRMLSLMRQMNELTTLHNSGYVGGVSKITDQLSPIPSNVGYSDRSLIETPTRILGTLYGASVNPVIPAIQGAAVIGGRGIDAITGRRSRVATYIKDNLGNSDGIQISDDAESVRETRRQETEGIKKANQEQRARAKEIHKSQYEKNGDLPFITLDAMLKERGLSPQRAVQLLEAMAAADPVIAADARAMIKAIQEGGRAPNMTAVGAAMSTALDQQSTSVTRDKTPVPGAAQAAAASAAAPRDVSAGYVRGIQDNQAANTALIEAVDADPTISDDDKAVLIDTLADLRSNLGANPADRAMDIAAKAESQVSDPALVETYVMPYVNRVIGQQASTQEETNFMAVPNFGEGQAVRPVPPLQTEKVLGSFDAEGQYVAMPQGEVISGNTYDGARIYINSNGFGGMEVDATQQLKGKADDKSLGRPFRTNLYKKFNTSKNGKKTMNLWDWSERPEGHTRGENDQEFLVAFVHSPKKGDPKKHYYTLDLQMNVPTTLDKDQSNIKAGFQPFLRPSGHGVMTLGNPVAKIKTGQGREHVIYDTIKVEPEQQPVLNLQRDVLSPALENASDVFGIGSDIGMTAVSTMPTDAEFAEMQAGTFKPAQKKKLEVAYGDYHDGWKQAAGTDTPLEYTPENIDRIARMMATEALRAIKRDGSAIGWYDAKLKAAKSVMKLVEPRISGNEAAFDFALAVTSNGQAVLDNFAQALEVFRIYMKTGKMPANWNKGGERKKAMQTSFKFYNAYQQSGSNMPIEMFLDTDFTVKEISQWVDQFNATNGTDIGLSVTENADTTVKGSFILGAKIGQGFYQNVRGNYDPLTMDIWWMRMWNRLIGRPFKPAKSAADMQKNRNIIIEQGLDAKDGIEKQLVDATLQRLGTTRSKVRQSKGKIDDFSRELNRTWNSYYSRYQKENGTNPVKPQLFKTVGTHFKNLAPELQATPTSGGERSYMRDVTARARELLLEQGYDINTADFQALMWYPEKHLAQKMGVAKGKGDDNDYLDAAIEAATKEGISNDQIQEALPDAERARLFGGTDTGRQDGGSSAVVDTVSGKQAESINRQQGVLDLDDGGNNGRAGDTELPKTSLAGSREPTPEENREALSVVKAAFEVGKPGSPYENGIRDYDTISKIGQAFNHVFHLATSQTDLAKKLQVKRKQLTDTKGARVSLPSPEGYKLGRGARFGIIQSKAKKYKGSDIFAALHELGHAIETSYVDEAARQEGSENLGRDFYSPLSQQTINDPANNATYSNTFRAAVRELLELFGDKKVATGEFTNQDARDIINEVIRMQRTGILEGFGTKFPVRTDYSKGMEFVSKGKVTQSKYDTVMREGERTYFHTPYELAADLLGIYMFDPKLAKREMPKATKLVRLLLKDNPNIQFFSAPFSAVVAMVMANMLLAEKEDEEEKALLTLGRGALTA